MDNIKGQMRYFPIFLDIKDRPVVVVGGGRVGERKVSSLLKAGAKVKVISPHLTKNLKRLAERGRITPIEREYKRGDLKGTFLAIAATADCETNQQVFEEGIRRRIPVNVVDSPAQCSFIVPSIISRGDLTLAISTGGKSPALAKKIRKELQNSFGPEYARLLKLLGAVRRKLLQEGSPSDINKMKLTKLIESPILPLMREGRRREIDELLRKILGPGYNLKALGIR